VAKINDGRPEAGQGLGFEGPMCHGGAAGQSGLHDPTNAMKFRGQPLFVLDTYGVRHYVSSVAIHGYGGYGAVLGSQPTTLPCWVDGRNIDPTYMAQHQRKVDEAVANSRKPQSKGRGVSTSRGSR
jgi:hypothetical protein